MKKIVSFGDSFVYGTELKNNPDGSQAWPALAAGMIGAQYQTLAQPGCGNDAILRQLLTYFNDHDPSETLAVINWTWAIRFDFYHVGHEQWNTLGPTCVPEKLSNLLPADERERVINFYRDYLGNSTVWDRWRSLQAIYAAQQYLSFRNIRSIQTHMDLEIFDQEFHSPNYIRELQNLVKPQLETFEGLNFLDWSRQQGFEVTDPGLHPLEQAHQSAAELWSTRYALAFQ